MYQHERRSFARALVGDGRSVFRYDFFHDVVLTHRLRFKTTKVVAERPPVRSSAPGTGRRGAPTAPPGIPAVGPLSRTGARSSRHRAPNRPCGGPIANHSPCRRAWIAPATTYVSVCR